MSNEEQAGNIHIDSDWKTEAAREKERLAAQEKKERERKQGKGEGGATSHGFLDLLSLLAMQASVALGGATGPGGEPIPSNPANAKHYIDLLEVIKEKTAGNLSSEEDQTLNSLLYELQMHYVAIMRGSSGATPPPGTGAPGAPGKRG